MYTVRTFTKEDIDGIVKIHKICFPDYFLTNLGDEFIKMYYNEYCNSQYAVSKVVIDDKGNILGFICGSLNYREQISKFYKENFIKLTTIFIKKFFTNKIVFRNAKSRINHIFISIKSLFRNNKNKTKDVKEDILNPRFQSLAVLHEYRGKDVAKLLMENLFNDMKNRNVQRVGSAVLKDNQAALKFCKKIGWYVEKESGPLIYLLKDI